MNQKYHALIQYVHEGESIRQIARNTGIHRETISKYVREYEKKRHKLMEGGKNVQTEALIESLTEKPIYHTGARPKRKITPQIEQRIRDFLEENRQKRHRGQTKQQKTVMDMYEALEEDHDISYSTVRRLVRQMDDKPKEAFIKSTYLPGDVCEFDWGEVKLTIEDRLRTLQMAVFTSAYGNYRWACMFPKQTTECFQEAHSRFFAHINGVYTTVTYDNMKVAVKRLAGQEKAPTEGLMQLTLYYGFSYRFCNIRRGNEKGHVERSVDVIRRKAFAFRDKFESLEDVNQYLEMACDKRNQKPMAQYEGLTPRQRLEKERDNLLQVPPKWDAAHVSHVRVDKYATVIVDQNRYSVPDHLVGKMVMIKVYAEHIHCFYHNQCVARHGRLVGHHRWSLELPHVLETLQKKPGALAGSLALHQADKKLKDIYTTYYKGNEKDFIALCHYVRDEAEMSDVIAGIRKLRSIHPKHVTTDKIKAVCAKSNDPLVPPAASTKDTQNIAGQARRHMKQYEQLLESIGGGS